MKIVSVLICVFGILVASLLSAIPAEGSGCGFAGTAVYRGVATTGYGVHHGFAYQQGAYVVPALAVTAPDYYFSSSDYHANQALKQAINVISQQNQNTQQLLLNYQQMMQNASLPQVGQQTQTQPPPQGFPQQSPQGEAPQPQARADYGPVPHGLQEHCNKRCVFCHDGERGPDVPPSRALDLSDLKALPADLRWYCFGKVASPDPELRMPKNRQPLPDAEKAMWQQYALAATLAAK